MRKMRSTLVVAVSLALLGGLGGAVVAKEEESAGIVDSTLEEGTPAVVVAPGTTTYTSRDVRQLRGLEATWTQEHSDPRLSGTVTFVYNEDDYPARVGPKWGHTTIENSGGTWVGLWLGMEVPRDEPEWFPVYITMATGTGDYEGLSAMCYMTFPKGPGQKVPVEECVIFEGPLPDISTPTAE
mgnify:CR=1 FL=1